MSVRVRLWVFRERGQLRGRLLPHVMIMWLRRLDRRLRRRRGKRRSRCVRVDRHARHSPSETVYRRLMSTVRVVPRIDRSRSPAERLPMTRRPRPRTPFIRPRPLIVRIRLMMLQVSSIVNTGVICMSRRLDRSPRTPGTFEGEPGWTVKRSDCRDRGDTLTMRRLGRDDRLGHLFRDRRGVLPKVSGNRVISLDPRCEMLAASVVSLTLIK